MIGREGPVQPFALLRWARQQARDKDLKPLEAHVLLLLATYANEQAIAWPSIATLARDAALRVTVRHRRGGRVEESNSSISAALVRLEELQLIWRRQAGRGRPATCELLCPGGEPSGRQEGNGRIQPSGLQEGKESQPSGTAEGMVPSAAGSSPPAPRSLPSGTQEEKYQGTANGRTARTSTSEGPDDALRHTGGQPALQSETERTDQPELGVHGSALHVAGRAA
jgi:hypothetical protein